jgi:predicted MFS family arabinose efflux permease
MALGRYLDLLRERCSRRSRSARSEWARLRSEAYAWQIVAYVAGASLGTWLAGALVDAVSVEAALACVPAFAAAGLLVALSGRRSLAPRLPG